MSCYPFGPSILCSCDSRGRPVSCLPVLDYSVGLGIGHGTQGGGDVWDMGRWREEQVEVEEYKEQETEVILAFTLLVMIVLMFIG